MKKVEEKKKERNLNKGQIATLKLLYQYRFITSELLAKVEGKKHLQVTRSRLATLEKQGYIGRRYDSSYKLLGKFAAYYLLPKGLQYLKSVEVAEPQAIKMIYNDRKASGKFVDFCLQVCSTAQSLLSFYGDEVKVFSRTELLNYDYFPQPQPDLYMSIKRKPVRHYFVDLYDDNTPAFVMAKKLRQYIDHCESGEWDSTDSAYPEIVIACTSPAAEQRVRKKLSPIVEGVQGSLAVYTVTEARLLDESAISDNPFKKI